MQDVLHMEPVISVETLECILIQTKLSMLFLLQNHPPFLLHLSPISFYFAFTNGPRCRLWILCVCYSHIVSNHVYTLIYNCTWQAGKFNSPHVFHIILVSTCCVSGPLKLACNSKVIPTNILVFLLNAFFLNVFKKHTRGTARNLQLLKILIFNSCI